MGRPRGKVVSRHIAKYDTSTQPLKVAPTTLISASAACTGSYMITPGSKTIVERHACLTSNHGPVGIGDGCIISERAFIGLLEPPQNEKEVEGWMLPPGALIEGASIGAYTINEAGAKIGKGTVIGANSKFCAGVEIGEGDV